jgi:hypothetical protein
MLTTTDYVRQILKESPFIAEILRNDWLNLSQYAKSIQLEIETKTYKTVQLGSIITALTRIRAEVKEKFEIKLNINDVSLKIPITEFNFAKNADHNQKISRLYQELAKVENSFLNIISGNTETGIFVNSKYEQQVLAIFSTQKPNLFLPNLGAISIKFDSNCLEVSGVVYQILKYLVWENINLLEVISTYTELTLIVNQNNTHKTFEILSKKFVV